MAGKLEENVEPVEPADPVEPARGEAKAIKRSLLLVIVGLVVMVFTLYDVTPGSFVLFACLSVPLVVAGILYYVWTVLTVLRRTRGL